MIANKELVFSKDLANKKVHVVREFDAPVEQVWKAWTESEILDQWWAPRPWKTETKSMDFREGGRWLYSMVGPEGERHYCLADYQKIVPNKSYTYIDAFCDENGNKGEDFPNMHWLVEFKATGQGTTVAIEISFSSEDSFQKIIEMGFEQGFTMALGNLDEVLAK
ncbi:SRPBCC domain-containing protein [Pseudoflavitalea sp. X16]|uniref:SRPBCC family protein n=1 Tax=Paraflavitalea devenefica TaxID=2716334 RepID=UPI001422C68B|nr:SRPBCC domain-containing protein [Paraflavitalea devenefica]NII27047.1 SRPBCC domain-containing protein [Paraflavitalea devenefica]